LRALERSLFSLCWLVVEEKEDKKSDYTLRIQ
jgi:hypothetical protein